MTSKKILIPLDGSQLSRVIVPHVCRLLGRGDYHMILLRVAEPLMGITALPPRPVSLGWIQPVYEHARDLEYSRHPIYASQLEQGQRTALEQTLLDDRHALEQAGYEVTIAIRFGRAADEIVDLARRQKVDLVAMATHGETGLRRLLLGSVAEEVLSRLAIPVLLVRPFDGESD